MEYLHTLLKFIAGGGIIVGVTYIAQQVNPKYGGILAAAPIITTLAFLFTYNEVGRETTRQLVMGTFFFAIPSLAFLISLYFLMNRAGFLESIAGAYGIWVVCVLIVSRFISGI
ncbi:MAG: DUF3147 family protein [Methanoregula sp.]|nr:DUF3147 family protein [Methanoregula sp.]